MLFAGLAASILSWRLDPLSLADPEHNKTKREGEAGRRIFFPGVVNTLNLCTPGALRPTGRAWCRR